VTRRVDSPTRTPVFNPRRPGTIDPGDHRGRAFDGFAAARRTGSKGPWAPCPLGHRREATRRGHHVELTGTSGPGRPSGRDERSNGRGLLPNHDLQRGRADLGHGAQAIRLAFTGPGGVTFCSVSRSAWRTTEAFHTLAFTLGVAIHGHRRPVTSDRRSTRPTSVYELADLGPFTAYSGICRQQHRLQLPDRRGGAIPVPQGCRCIMWKNKQGHRQGQLGDGSVISQVTMVSGVGTFTERWRSRWIDRRKILFILNGYSPGTGGNWPQVDPTTAPCRRSETRFTM